MSLSRIGDKYGTQKNTHKSFGQTILDIYEPYFEPLKNEKINILEIGVLDGASIRTWHHYFRLAKIFGIDLVLPQLELDRVRLFKADQGDIFDLADVRTAIGEKFDIIIDDGSHINDFTLFSFEFFWDSLKSGGYYIIEDTICTYDKASHDWPGMHLNRKVANFDNKREDVNEFIVEKLRQMDFNKSEIFYMHFYRNLIIMKKA